MLLGYVWRQVSGPGDVIWLTRKDVLLPQVLCPVAGVYVLGLSADDGEAVGSDTVVVTAVVVDAGGDRCAELGGSGVVEVVLDGTIAGTGVVDNEGTHAFLMIPDYDIADLDCDGVVNMADLAELSSQWETTQSTTDIEPCGGDGITNLVDFAKFARKWQGDYPLYPYDIQSDFDLDGLVEKDDLAIFTSQFLKRNIHNADIAPWPGLDGVVDLQDLTLIAEQWLSN